MSAANDKALQANIIDRYGRDNPRAGVEFETWVETVAEELGVKPSRVRAVILEVSQGYLTGFADYARTYAQRAADVMGASVIEAMNTLRAGMLATKQRPVVIGKGEDARVEIFEVPDWASRLTAATRTLDIHGGWAPKQVEINSRSVNVNLSDAELVSQLQELTGQIAAYTSSVAGGNQARLAEGANPEQRTEGSPGSPRSLLLVDGVYQDGGRAERDSVQAIPEGTVHKAPARRPRKRNSPAD